MANIDRRKFDSADSAFEALNADTVPFARLATNKMAQVGTALSTLNQGTRPGGVSPYQRSMTVYDLISKLLVNGKVRLSDKSWKCVKIKGSDDVCFYSDSYRLHTDNANLLAQACHNVGLEVRIFEWDYPERDFDEKDPPPSRTAKIMFSGYKQLCRGKLVGFVVGAYNNPFDALKKKRRRE